MTQKPNTSDVTLEQSHSGVTFLLIGIGIFLLCSILSKSVGFGFDIAIVFWVSCMFARKAWRKLARQSTQQTKRLVEAYTNKQIEINIEGYKDTTIIDQELRELPSPIVGHFVERSSTNREQSSQSSNAVDNYSVNSLPAIVRYGDIVKSKPASKTAFPLGKDTMGTMLWGDLQGDNLHIGVWGATGGGKDTLLRSIFYTLTTNNTSDEIQFAVIDAKGDWLVDNLKNRSHMFFNPVGGVGKEGQESLQQGIEAVLEEMARRFKLVQSYGFRTREAYVQETGNTLPLLVVVLTDITKSIEKIADDLLTDLVAKGRAAGMRVLVSTQTPSNMSMSWRANISTNISFHQPDSSQNAACLGYRQTRDLPILPSDIPSGKAARGVFVLRATQLHLVRGVFIDEMFFDQYVNSLPRLQRPTYTESIGNNGSKIATPTEIDLVEGWLEEYGMLSGREIARRLYCVAKGLDYDKEYPRGIVADGKYDGSGDLFYKAKDALERVTKTVE
jgi:hypothetical protein